MKLILNLLKEKLEKAVEFEDPLVVEFEVRQTLAYIEGIIEGINFMRRLEENA